VIKKKILNYLCFRFLLTSIQYYIHLNTRTNWNYSSLHCKTLSVLISKQLKKKILLNLSPQYQLTFLALFLQLYPNAKAVKVNKQAQHHNALLFFLTVENFFLFEGLRMKRFVPFPEFLRYRSESLLWLTRFFASSSLMRFISAISFSLSYSPSLIA